MSKLNKIIPVTMTPEFWNKTRYLCKTVPSSKEWSGVLFYKYPTHLNPADRDFTIEMVDLYLMDIGTEGYTEYTNSVDAVSYMVQRGYLEGYARGTVHSHHNMDTFFSKTDESDGEDNSKHYNFYVSIITNNKNEWKGRVYINSPYKYINYLRDSMNNLVPFTTEGEESVYFECDVQLPGGVVDDEFKQRFAQVLKEYNSKPVYKSSKAKGYSSNPVQNFEGWNGYSENFYSKHSQPAIAHTHVTIADIKNFLNPKAISLEAALKEKLKFSSVVSVDDEFLEYYGRKYFTVLNPEQELKVLQQVVNHLKTLSIQTETKNLILKEFNEGIEFIKTKYDIKSEIQ